MVGWLRSCFCNMDKSEAFRLSLQLQLYPHVIGLNDETGMLSSTSLIKYCRLW